MPRVVKATRSRKPIIMIGLLLATIVIVSMFYALAAPPKLRIDSRNSALVSRGQNIYRANCAVCHGANLEGQPNWKERLPNGLLPAPPHDVSGHTWHHADTLLFGIVKNGGASALLPGDKSGMPAFGASLSDEDIMAVLSYIKSTWPADIQQRQEMVTQQSSP